MLWRNKTFGGGCATVRGRSLVCTICSTWEIGDWQEELAVTGRRGQKPTGSFGTALKFPLLWPIYLNKYFWCPTRPPLKGSPLLLTSLDLRDPLSSWAAGTRVHTAAPGPTQPWEQLSLRYCFNWLLSPTEVFLPFSTGMFGFVLGNWGLVDPGVKATTKKKPKLLPRHIMAMWQHLLSMK